MRFLYILLFFVLIIEGACSNNKASSSVVPDIPDSLSTDEEKASYFVSHFWDEMDFKDRSLSLDTAFMEQSFSNFIAMIPIVPEDTAEEAVKQLVGKAAVDKDAFNLLTSTADLYLDHPDSPMRNEETYILFLKSFLEINGIPENIKKRYEYRLAQAMKNRPGSKAPDFKVTLRDGKNSNLNSLLGEGENIVMFYDSDCEHCKEISGRLAEMQFNDDVRIIAIDVAGDRRLWDEKKGSLPADWTVCYDLDNIEDKELFYLPALPTFYILDSGGVIIAKDPLL